MMLFLDIDGVMVPAKSWEAPVILQDGFAAFSKQATAVLRQLVADGATIMLTTSHKSNYSIQEWKEIFRNRGIEVSSLQRLDNNIGHLSRKEEIEKWFNLHMNYDNFVILDDDKQLNALPAHLKAKLLLTSSAVGLMNAHLEQIRLLATIPLERA